MSNAWRDDGFYGQPWVRVAGPIATALYQAAEDYCHRELSGAFIPRSELEIALPWPLRDGELDAATGILERLGRFVRESDGFVLPKYAIEQEDDDAQASRAAQAKRAADARWEKQRERRAKRHTNAQPMLRASKSCSEHESSMVEDASYPSYPSYPSGPSVKSGPMSPTGTAAASPRRAEPPPPPPSEPDQEPRPSDAGSGSAKPARPPKAKRPAHPNRQAYLAAFHEAHKAASGGAVYTWTGRELAMLDRQCDEIPLDRWKTACAGYAKRLPAWLFTDTTPDLGSFTRNFNAFAAAASVPAAPSTSSPSDWLRIGAEWEKRHGNVNRDLANPRVERVDPRSVDAG